MELVGVIRVAQWVAALLFLAIGAVLDVKKREIPETLPYAFIAVEAVLLAARLVMGGVPENATAYAAIDALILLVMGVLVAACLIGPGDLAMMLGVVLSEPFGYKLLPLPLLVLLYSSLLSLALVPVNLIANLSDPEARRRLARQPLTKRLVRLFTARLVEVERITRGEWWVPLDIRETRRSVCSTEVTPAGIVQRLVEQGVLGPKQKLWATYGIPALVTMLAGYLVALIVGDTPILVLLAGLLARR